MKTFLKHIMMLVSLTLAFLVSPTAHAQVIPGQGLLDFGPIADGPGGLFPSWYMDRSGVALEACVDGPPLCINDPVDPADPVSVAVGFGAEAFYWAADAAFPPNSLRVSLVLFALELAWANEVPAVGDAMVFSRIRIRLFGLPNAGPWTITHPYGAHTFTADPDPVAGFRINFSDDVGIVAGQFGLAMTAQHTGPFLRQVTAPAGFLGSPAVARPVTGGPNGNSVTVRGPGFQAPQPPFLSTSRFTIQGKLATNGGIQGGRATFSRNPDGTGFVNARASSIGGQRIVADGVGAARQRLIPIAGRVGVYSASIPFLATDVFAPVTIRNLTDASRPFRTINTVPDVVTIESATFDGTTLVVRASSSDLLPRAQGGPRLDVFSGPQLLGRINARGTSTLPTVVSPLRVVVVSSAGGTTSARVVFTAPAP